VAQFCTRDRQSQRSPQKKWEKVREIINELGGSMPEDLLTPEEPIAKVEHKHKSISEDRKD
jgi:hypothetical protein